MKTFIVDAFTDQPFKGNPAGVCVMENDLDAVKMQAIANELNLSETAFLKKSQNSETEYAIRYFTPCVEIDFCGHATLASAKVVLHHLDQSFVNFTTFRGLKLVATSTNKNIKMIFPLYNTTDFLPNKKLIKAFGIKNYVAIKFAKELDMLLIELPDKHSLINLKPDFRKATAATNAIKEVVVTVLSNDTEYDFYSRCLPLDRNRRRPGNRCCPFGFGQILGRQITEENNVGISIIESWWILTTCDNQQY